MRWRFALLAGLWMTLIFPISTHAESPKTQFTIDLAGSTYEFRGWGTSLAWWAHGIGDWPDEKLDPLIHLIVDPRGGLGLTIFRYNIGGGDDPSHQHMRRWANMPGFRVRADEPYDWSADAAQRRVLGKIIHASNTPPILEAFSNSPPWWMTKSGCASGAFDGMGNLKQEYEPYFANYLADVLAHLRQSDRLTFESLEPFNEPDADWWRAGTKQEGTHVSPAQQVRIIRLVRAALDQHHLNKIIISANDANNLDHCLNALRSFDAPALASIGRINTHSYSGTHRALLRDFAALHTKPLWVSESGPLGVHTSEYDQALVTAARIVTDLNQLRPEVWCMWQAVANSGWGAFHADANDNSFRIGKLFYILSHFTRTMRPGDRILPLDSNCALASISKLRGELTVIFVNIQPAAQTIMFKTKPALAAPAVGVLTTATENFTRIAPVAAQDGAFTTTVPPASVITLTIPIPGR